MDFLELGAQMAACEPAGVANKMMAGLFDGERAA